MLDILSIHSEHSKMIFVVLTTLIFVSILGTLMYLRIYHRERWMVVEFSRAMTKVLRHDAVKLGFSMDENGFVNIDDVLRVSNKLFRKKNKKRIGDNFKDFNLSELMSIVNKNKKKRFEVCGEKIRASQGHTISGVDPGLKQIPQDEAEGLFGYHGTYHKSLEEILKSGGLSKMGRCHIHMTKISPDIGKVISGARSTCDVIVVVNVKHAMKDGLKFFFSKNEVLLSSGNDDGMIPVKYFHRIYNRRTDEEVVVKDKGTGEVLWPIVPLASA